MRYPKSMAPILYLSERTNCGSAYYAGKDHGRVRSCVGSAALCGLAMDKNVSKTAVIIIRIRCSCLRRNSLEIESLDVLAQRVLARKIVPRKGLAHDHRSRLVEPLRVSEKALPLQRNAKGCLLAPRSRPRHQQVGPNPKMASVWPRRLFSTIAVWLTRWSLLKTR
jgi:hypothetical protein